MRLTRLSLRNFGGHVSRDFEGLDVAILGISGKNGEGKTTLLRALKYDVTGELPEDNAQGYMYNGGVNGTTVVDGTFRTQNRICSIERKITKSGQTRKLTFAGSDEKFTSDKDVRSKLRDMLGADLTTIGNAVFVPQGKLDELLFSSEAVREQQFLRMIGCAHFANVAITASKEAAQLLAGIPDVSAAITETTEQLRDHNSRWSTLREDADSKPDLRKAIEWVTEHAKRVERMQASDAALTACQQEVAGLGAVYDGAFLRGAETCKALAAEAKKKANEHRAAEAKHQSLLNELREFIKAKNGMNSALQQMTAAEAACPDVTLADRQAARMAELVEEGNAKNGELTQLPHIAKNIRELREAEAELNEATTGLNALGEAPSGVPPEHLRELVSSLSMQKKLMESLIKHLGENKHEAQHCPTCNGVIDPSLLDTTKLEQVSEQLLQAQMEYEKNPRARNAWESARMNFNARISSAQHKKENASKGIPPTFAGKTEAEVDQRSRDLAVALQALRQEYATLQQQNKATVAAAAEVKKARTAAMEAQNSYMKLWAGKAVQMDALNHDTLTSEIAKWKKAAEDEDEAHNAQNVQAARLEQKHNEDVAARARFAKAQQTHQATSTAFAESWNVRPIIIDELSKRLPTWEAVKEELDASQKQRDALFSAADEIQKTITSVTARLADLEAQRDKGAKARLVAERLNLIASAFQRDGISRHYTAAVYAQLLTLVGQNLASLDANFVVRLAEGVMCFEFMRTDKEGSVWLPQHWLSGGQRVRMAVAFLLAVQQLILPEVGLLVLDEPTDGLDPEGKEALRDTLERAAEILDKNDAQLIVCDHSGILDPAYRAVIKL
mgnify:CR=1 FL=1